MIIYEKFGDTLSRKEARNGVEKVIAFRLYRVTCSVVYNCDDNWSSFELLDNSDTNKIHF